MMRMKAAPLAAILCALVGCATTSASAAREPFGRLSLADVDGMRGKPGVYIFDNNRKERFAQSHVPGAVWVPYASFDASQMPADKDAKLVFYCANTW